MARILVISNLFPPDAQGGYELTCGDVVRRWRAGGHDVEVLSASGGELPATSLHAPVPTRLQRLPVERRAQQALRAALGRRPDAVSVWNMAGLPISLLATLATSGVPVVYVLADSWPVRSPPADPWLSAVQRLPRPVAAALGRIASVPSALPPLGPTGRWVFCSRSLRDDVIEALPGDGPFDDVTVVHFGVDLGDFPLVDAPRDRSWGGRLLFVGRLDATKGIDSLVRAMPLMPQTTLTVLGPPEAHHIERIRALIAEVGVGDRVLVASAPRSTLAGHYRAADACVFPSEWAEPFGIVPLEAMACATPVIATGVGGSGEYLVDGENALLFSPGDPEALAAQVKRLAADRELRDHVTTRGLATAAAHTTERVASELLSHHLLRQRAR